MLAHPPSLGGSSGGAKHFRAQPVQLSKCGGSRELVAEPCATGSQTVFYLSNGTTTLFVSMKILGTSYLERKRE